jgi:hypothetical protein
MLKRSLMMIRLGQFGLAWIGTFLVVLLAALAARFALGLNLIAVADLLLSLSLILLGVAILAALAATWIARTGLPIKIAVTLLIFVLALPLLWSPVLAVVVAAKLADTPIEYSTVYAGFRIAVSRLLYPIFQIIFSGAAIGAVWKAFEAVATVVGFAASSLELWRFLRKQRI